MIRLRGWARPQEELQLPAAWPRQAAASRRRVQSRWLAESLPVEPLVVVARWAGLMVAAPPPELVLEPVAPERPNRS